MSPVLESFGTTTVNPMDMVLIATNLLQACWQHDFANPLMYRKNYWNLDEKTEETSPCIILKQFCISSCRVYKTSRFTSWLNLQSGLPGLSSSCIGVTLFVYIRPLPQTVMELTGRWTRKNFSLFISSILSFDSNTEKNSWSSPSF
jgi:hypothetical protein